MIDMEPPRSKHVVQHLNRMIRALSRLIYQSTQHYPLLQVVGGKEAKFEWYEQWKEALTKLKQVLSPPSIVT